MTKIQKFCTKDGPGIRTTLETCGYFDAKLLPALVETTDLFLWNIKDTDEKLRDANEFLEQYVSII